MSSKLKHRSARYLNAAGLTFLLAGSCSALAVESPGIDVAREGNGVRVSADGVTVADTLAALETELGVEIRGLPASAAGKPVSGATSGSLEQVIRWLLAGEEFLTVVREKPSVSGAGGEPRIWVIGHADGKTVSGNDATGGAGFSVRNTGDAAPQTGEYGSKTANGNPAVTTGAGAARPDPKPAAALEEKPKTLAEIMEDNTPYAQLAYQAEAGHNVAPTVPPRHLNGSNDAAQVSVDEALARTTALARRNLQTLLDAMASAAPPAAGKN